MGKGFELVDMARLVYSSEIRSIKPGKYVYTGPLQLSRSFRQLTNTIQGSKDPPTSRFGESNRLGSWATPFILARYICAPLLSSFSWNELLIVPGVVKILRFFFESIDSRIDANDPSFFAVKVWNTRQHEAPYPPPIRHSSITTG